ncbi:MAG: hypothetical protein ACRC8A_13315 [Microcoleaceae cyanobacterium]
MSLADETRWSVFYETGNITQPQGKILPIQVFSPLTSKVIRVTAHSVIVRPEWYTAGYLSHRLTPAPVEAPNVAVQVQSDRIALNVKQILFLENVEEKAYLVFFPVKWLTSLSLAIEQYQ